MWNVVGVVAALLGLANLVFTFGVVRRLRGITEQLAKGGGESMPASPAVGTPAPEFALTTADGSLMTDADVRDGTFYIGYFTPSCAPCQERLPEFANFAREVGPDRALIVVGASDRDEGLRFVGAHGGGVRFAIEDHSGPLSKAFGFSRTPTMLMLEDGVVRRNAAIIGQLRVPVAA